MWCVFLPRMGMRWVVVPSNGGAHKIIVELIKVENDLGRNVGDLVELGGGQQRPLIPAALDIDRCPVPRADGADSTRIVGKPAPSVGARFDNLVVGVPDASREFVGAQIVPNILH